MLILGRGIGVWVAALSCLGIPVLAAEPKAEDCSPCVIELPGYAFDRGNARTFADPQQYADGGPMVAFGGQSPVSIQYDVELPVDGAYRISVRYAAADPRPVDFYVDQQLLGQCCRGTTGSWNTSSAQWLRRLRRRPGGGTRVSRGTCRGGCSVSIRPGSSPGTCL